MELSAREKIIGYIMMQKTHNGNAINATLPSPKKLPLGKSKPLL